MQDNFIKNLRYFGKLSEQVRSYLVYEGSQQGTFVGVTLVPLSPIHTLFD